MTHPDADFTRTAAALVAANDRVPEQRAGEDAVARELRLRLRSAEQMLTEAQRRVSDAEEALDAHLESRVTP